MYQMNQEERAERAKTKAFHTAVRGMLPVGDRYRNLAWGFVRGFPYRRIERSHHMQSINTHWAERMAPSDCSYRKIGEQWFYEHGMPSGAGLFELLQSHMPDLTREQIGAWLRDLSGSVPPPPPRPKRKHERPEEDRVSA